MALLGGISFWRKERASLRCPSPKNSPPDCFYSWNSVSAAGSFESLSFQFMKKVTPLGGISFWRKERASLCCPSPKNSPPDCFYSWNSVSAAGSFESLSFQFMKKVTPLGGISFWRKERASLGYPSPKNSPPDCFCGRNFVSAAGSFESPSFQFDKKSDPTMWDHFFGGKRGIRTLGAFIGHTRFPVVRLRPAQPSFHNGFCCVHSTRKCLIIISGRSKKVKLFLSVRPSSIKRSRRPPQGSLPEGSGGRNFYLL